MARHKRRFSADEKINMRLRLDAGETLESIADDYDCSVFSVRYNTDHKFRLNHLTRNKVNREIAGTCGSNKIKAARMRRMRVAERAKLCPK